MKRRFLELNKVHDIYDKAGEIAEFICPDKDVKKIESLRDRIYKDMINKAFEETDLVEK